MAQNTAGLYALLSHSVVYDAFQNMVGADRCRAALVADYIRAKAGDRILDVGCGTASILEYLPAVEYYGFDISETYVSSARRRYGDRAHFRAEKVSAESLSGLPKLDVVIAVGLLHHLDEADAHSLLSACRDALKRGGRFISLDPCFEDGQSAVARYVISRDRGRNVRNESGYRRLGGSAFESVVTHVRRDLLRIPYTHVVLECRA